MWLRHLLRAGWSFNRSPQVILILFLIARFSNFLPSMLFGIRDHRSLFSPSFPPKSPPPTRAFAGTQCYFCLICLMPKNNALVRVAEALGSICQVTFVFFAPCHFLSCLASSQGHPLWNSWLIFFSFLIFAHFSNRRILAPSPKSKLIDDQIFNTSFHAHLAHHHHKQLTTITIASTYYVLCTG